MSEKTTKDIKMDKKTGIIWVIIIALLVIGSQIAFLIALSRL